MHKRSTGATSLVRHSRRRQQTRLAAAARSSVRRFSPADARLEARRFRALRTPSAVVADYLQRGAPRVAGLAAPPQRCPAVRVRVRQAHTSELGSDGSRVGERELGASRALRAPRAMVADIVKGCAPFVAGRAPPPERRLAVRVCVRQAHTPELSGGGLSVKERQRGNSRALRAPRALVSDSCESRVPLVSDSAAPPKRRLVVRVRVRQTLTPSLRSRRLHVDEGQQPTTERALGAPRALVSDTVERCAPLVAGRAAPPKRYFAVRERVGQALTPSLRSRRLRVGE
jgi:hypothetical protein